jgi:hypothetical protein
MTSIQKSLNTMESAISQAVAESTTTVPTATSPTTTTKAGSLPATGVAAIEAAGQNVVAITQAILSAPAAPDAQVQADWTLSLKATQKLGQDLGNVNDEPAFISTWDQLGTLEAQDGLTVAAPGN